MFLEEIDHREGAPPQKIDYFEGAPIKIYQLEGASKKIDSREGTSPKNIPRGHFTMRVLHREGASKKKITARVLHKKKTDHLEGAFKILITARVLHKKNQSP